MQGQVIIKDAFGKVIGTVVAENFPLSAECQSFNGQENFIIKYSYLPDENKKGWKDRSKIKGLVMMKK